jgi:lipid-A-disaccharide synthase
MKVAQKLKSLDPELQIVISIAHPQFESDIKKLASGDVSFISSEKNYDLMRASYLSLATSGTVTLELALHETPTIVGFAIKPLDLFLAQKIFRINLPFYCIVNIIDSKEVYPELFGPYFTEETLFAKASKMWLNSEVRNRCLEGCKNVRKSLGLNSAAEKAAEAVFSLVDF